ncbi:MAG: LPS assembly protein LptD [Syntrophobacterales bacterium]|nr:LPS assembly protein LptD [Syntrophobacterales bacterium]
MKNLAIVFWLSSFFLLRTVAFAFTLFEVPLSKDLFSYGGDLPWTLTADKIEYIREEEAYRAEGRVILQSGNRKIEADRAILYKRDSIVKLKGNVFISYGEDWIRSDNVTWNLEKQSGYIEKGILYFAKNHFYVEAEHIHKLEGDEYIFERGFVTTCTLPSPDWSVNYKRLHIPPDGIARARNVVLQVGSVPVIFIPWFMVPVKAERQSGILMPVIGFSDLNGFIMEIPYYWVIGQSQDATFFGEILQKRGFMGGVEYRWNDAKWGEGIFITNYMRDLGDEERVRSHGFAMTERDRFWVRGRALMNLPENIEARINLDILSDRDFLNEFTRGSPSFEYTNEAFKSFLGTGLLLDRTKMARESNAYFFRRSEDLEVSLDLHYWDQNNPSLKSSTLQEIPSFGVSVGSSYILGTPLYYGLRSFIAQYWRDEGEQGTKLYIAPEFTLPWKVSSFINTKTTMALQGVLYDLEDGGSMGSPKGLEGRIVPIFSTEANMRLERQYNLNLWGTSSISHSISPEIGYEYAPEVGEGKVPSFDESSSVFYTNRIRYGVRSSLVANKEASNEEWARLRLFQYYRIGDQRVPLFENGFPSVTTVGNGFSDIYLDLEFAPHKYVDLSYSVATSPKDLLMRQHDIILSIRTFTGKTLGIEYRYRENSGVDEVIGSLNWDLRPWLSLGTYHNYSFAKQDMFKQGYSLTYRHGCWSLTASYEREGGDRRFFVTVNLVGLGQIGIR